MSIRVRNAICIVYHWAPLAHKYPGTQKYDLLKMGDLYD